MGIMIFIGVLIILILFVIFSYNGLIRLRTGTEEAFSTMDVYLKKRYDLIPNVVETVKGYATHEKETFEAITKARTSVQNATTIDSKIEGEANLSKTLKTLFAVAENYPELKADSNFLNLQNQLKNIEEDIANARKYYNAVVREYNIAIQVFPKNIIASTFKFKKKPMFNIVNTEERENIKVKF